MAELNFGLINQNLPGEIANSVQRGREDAVREQMAKQQLKTGALQQENIQMQLEQAKRDRDALAKMQAAFVANGKSPDLESNFDEMINSGISHFVDIGIQGKQKLLQQRQFANIMGGAVAPPAPAVAPSVATPTNALAPPVAAPSVGEPTNALAPSVAPPSNALIPSPAATNIDVAALRRKRDMFLAMGTTQSIAAARAIDADIALASKPPVYHVVPNVGLVDPTTGRVITPSTESAPTTVKEYEYAKQQGYKGSLFDFKREMALAGRAPGQPRAEPAPTVTSIQDPTNPNQMISINARDYRGGGVGSPGVIGLTGKTPAATAKQDAIDKGHAQLASVVDDLRASYDTLEKAAAIPSTKRGTISNLMSSTQASGIGQFLGRMGGTEEQSARDTINSSRMMLLNSIKQATGMSAQQLNSNVELTSWLKAVSDPTQSTETVNKILGNIEKFVESGGKYSAKKDSAAAAHPAANAVTNPEFPGFSVKKP